MDMPSYACECMRPELKHAITLTKPACIRISFPLFNVYIKYTEMYMHRRQKKGGKEKRGKNHVGTDAEDNTKTSRFCENRYANSSCSEAGTRF